MKEKYMRIFMTSLFIFLSFSVLVCSATSYFSIDDRSPELSYTSRSTYYLIPAFDGSVSRLSYGASVTFTMYGDELYVYACRSTNNGQAAIYLDGTIVGYTSTLSVASQLSDPSLVFTKIDCGPGKHEVVIMASQQTVTQYNGQIGSSYFYLDRVEVCKDPDTQSIYQSYILILLTAGLGLQLVGFCIKFVLWRLLPDD